jgi:hypothetical protein
MKKAIALLAVFMMAIAVIPMHTYAFPHLCKTTFGVKVEGKWTFNPATGDYVDPYILNFTEPEYGFCKNFKVEVWALGVTDLYAYDFVLLWDGFPDYFVLVDYKVEQVFASQFIVKPDEFYKPPYPGWYRQAVSALAPSVGVSGDFKLATLTFHIENDACWTCDFPKMFWFWIDVQSAKMSDSCGNSILLCNPFAALVRYKPMQPKIMIHGLSDDYEQINWVVGEEFTLEIWVEDIVKMKDIEMNISWNGWVPIQAARWVWGYSTAIIDPWHDPTAFVWTGQNDGVHGLSGWTPIVNPLFEPIVVAKDVVLNRAVFGGTYDHSPYGLGGVRHWEITDPAERFARFGCDGLEYDGVNNWFVGPAQGAYGISFSITLNDMMPLFNGTTWLFKIHFKKVDPWVCGRQPRYTFTSPHTWRAGPAGTDFYLQGNISVKCPYDTNIQFATWPFCYIWGYGARQYTNPFDYMDWTYTPISARDMSCFNVTDLHGWAICAHEYIVYSTATYLESGAYTFYPIPGDLNGDGHVDIIDLMIIAKYYGDPATNYPGYYYNLDGTDGVDIFDVVIVAKNFCRTSPF